MGGSSSAMRLPANPVDAIRALRLEITQLQKEAATLGSSFNSLPYESYFVNARMAAEKVLQLRREAVSRKLPDPDSIMALLTLAESIASSACTAFGQYMRDGSILLEKVPSIMAIATLYAKFGVSSACLQSTAKLEAMRRRGVRDGTLNVLRQAAAMPYGRMGAKKSKKRVKFQRR